MKLLIDANLPISLTAFFADHEVVHTLQLQQGNLTPDKSINEISLEEEYAVITKDADFYYSFIARQGPYKLALVRLGNMRLRDLKEYFRRNAHAIIELLHQNSFIILESDKIRIVS
jgi:predicted nuclease of predicted toxin-antitoxin system